MDKIVINTTARQADGNHKISFTVTFEDNSHFSGFVFVTEPEFAELNLKGMRQTIVDAVKKNFMEDK